MASNTSCDVHKPTMDRPNSPYDLKGHRRKSSTYTDEAMALIGCAQLLQVALAALDAVVGS